jgi:hypothetical protein
MQRGAAVVAFQFVMTLDISDLAPWASDEELEQVHNSQPGVCHFTIGCRGASENLCVRVQAVNVMRRLDSIKSQIWLAGTTNC